MRFKVSILIFCLLFIFDISAQNRPRYSAGFDVKIPRIISNNGFQKAMFGIADVDLNCSFLPTSYISVGVDYKYAYYQINNKFIQTQSAGQAELNIIGLSLFYINNVSEITYAKFGNFVSFFNSSPPLFAIISISAKLVSLSLSPMATITSKFRNVFCTTGRASPQIGDSS